MCSGAAGRIVNQIAQVQAPILVPIKPVAEIPSQSLHEGEEYNFLHFSHCYQALRVFLS